MGALITLPSAEEPFLSFILPTYNEEENIEACLRSIFSQNYPKDRFEVLVIDGGSTDKTLQIAGQYPVIIRYNKKRVTSNAKRMGVLVASGEFVVLLDADSELVGKNWIKSVLTPFMDTNVAGVFPSIEPKRSHPTISRCIAMMGSGDPTLAVIAYARGFKDIRARGKYLVMNAKNFRPNVGTGIYRRRLILDAGNFRPNLLRLEDPDLVYRIARRGFKFIYLTDAKIHHLYASSYSEFVRKAYVKIRYYLSHNHGFDLTQSQLKKGRGILSFILSLPLFFITLIRGKDLSSLYYPILFLTDLLIFFIVFLFVRAK